MNTNDGQLVEFRKQLEAESMADHKAAFDQYLDNLNRAERRKNGTTPWVAVSPRVAAIVRAGHAAMKDKKRRRKIAAASRARNR